MQFQDDRLAREEMIRDYLPRKVDPDAAEALESCYLESDECFEELTTTRMMIAALERPRLATRRLQDITVVQFTAPVSLTRKARETEELCHVFDEMRGRSDTRVLIDMSRVTRVDSSGLGALMACYSHAVRSEGILKLLNPNAEVRNVLRLTRIDSVLESYDDEQEALRSFGTA
jgi:anti-sigma B factor antagonist